MVAQVQPLDLVAPGRWGVNFEQANSQLSPEWATVLHEAILDSSGRPAGRGGYSSLTSTPITSTPAVKTLHEYIREAGTRTLIVAWDGGIAESISDPEGSDISGSVTDSNGTWWFQNFDDEVWGFQHGQKPIVYNGSGDFATVSESSGTAPTIADGVGLAAYGRIWGLDSDRQTIKFSGLLDGTAWNSGGAGAINMRNIWTDGTDVVTAIVAFNSRLLVFGRRHIVFFDDGIGSPLGLNPAQLEVTDVIAGTGAESQWSLQQIGEADLLFASKHGLQSLGRVIQQRSAPLGTLTSKVRSQFLRDLNAADADDIRTVVEPVTGAYIISFPEQGRSWVFFYSRPFPDPVNNEPLYPVTTWSLAPTAWLYDSVGLRTLLGAEGIVGHYAATTADAGESFTFDYESGWLALGEADAYLKILKRLRSLVLVGAAVTVNYKWYFDFQTTKRTFSLTYGGVASAEWGEAEWGSDEWSGALALRDRQLPAHGTGQYIKVGMTVDLIAPFALQMLKLQPKIGRMV